MLVRSDPRGGTKLSTANLGVLDSRIRTPRYARTGPAHGIVHIGVGGFHRAHQAVYVDELLEADAADWSISGAGVMDGDAAMADALRLQDFLYALVTRNPSETTVRIVGSLFDFVQAAADLEPLVARLAAPETRIVSLTITEGGYPVDEANGDFVAPAIDRLPPTFTALAQAARRRRDVGLGGFTVVSCDNIMGNGATARTAMLGVAAIIEPGLGSWVERHVAFPNGMVDRITPATSDADREFLAQEYGLLDRRPVVAEPFIQWVIEDDFPYGRPPLEDVGVLFTSDVLPYEKLKLRILNAGHSTLAYLAALVGLVYVHDVMADEAFATFLRRFHDDEVTPSLSPVPGIDVADYKRAVADRFSNPRVGDQVARLCIDGTSKLAKFLIPTIESQLGSGGPVKLSALALAGWCQYLLGLTDDGTPIEVAADPYRDRAIEHARLSASEPAAFLGLTEVFGPRLPNDPAFVDAFVAALRSIRADGTYRTLDRWLRTKD